MNRGVLLGVVAYTLWGFFPIYWKLLDAVPALEILAHRVVWTLVFLAGVLAVQGDWNWLKKSLQNKKTLWTTFVAGILLGINWLTYIWAVNSGFVVESSLGYFINPLVSVMMGIVFLGERLRRGQLAAVGLAALGVLYLTIAYGALPWIGLVLAFSFALYGLLKKTGALNATQGLMFESAVIFVPALVYLLYASGSGGGAFGRDGMALTLLLLLAGAVTAIPLLLFGAAARRIPLSTVGILQYIAPTLQFLLGVFVYKEPFPLERLIGFSVIWLALVVYTVEGLAVRRRKQRKKRGGSFPQ